MQKQNSENNIYVGNRFALGNTSSVFSRTVDDIKYTITYTGRLTNFSDLHKKLNEKGYSFIANTEAEIVLINFIANGNNSCKLLRGNFAYAIYNHNEDLLYIARDQLGIEPIYYYKNNDLFIFASEIKSILEHPDVNAKIGKDELCEIFGLGPAHTPGKTFFKDIYGVLPGHYMVVTRDGSYSYPYWDLQTFEVKDTVVESISKIKDMVSNSLNNDLISSLPICSMLSGGLDSSVLATLASKKIPNLNTFSIDFENNDVSFKGSSYQPTRDAEFVDIMKEKIGSNHTNLYFSTHELFDNLKTSMIARDMPGMADVDSSMLVFLKKIKESGFDIAISGECSDEIFGGYPWYYKEELIASKNFPWSRSEKIRSNIIAKGLVDENYSTSYISNAYLESSKNVIYNSEDTRENIFRRTCYNTIKWFMMALVERTKQLSSIAGIDVRIPFANVDIFDYVYNLSYKYKLGLLDDNTVPTEKYLLRKAFENELPKEVVYRKKSPFPKTYDPAYTKLLEDEIKKIINKSTSPILEIINVKYLYEILDSHGKNLEENWFGQLMTYPQTLAYFIQINMWLEEYNIEIDV